MYSVQCSVKLMGKLLMSVRFDGVILIFADEVAGQIMAQESRPNHLPGCHPWVLDQRLGGGRTDD